MNPSQTFDEAMGLALARAREFVGATSPNPPVGAAGIDTEGNILAVNAHERAGTQHAEVAVIEAFRAAGELESLDTLVVTLEPCNHQGQTGPCTEAIIAAGVKRVVLGARDPNPHVAGNGIERLRAAGIVVLEGFRQQECEDLITPWSFRIRTGVPYITVKRALRRDGSMIPPQGQKTFTSRPALRFAHELRRRADAIITGSGTILADDPLFTVRMVEDHPHKQRQLVLLDRRNRIPQSWVKAAKARGFVVHQGLELRQAILLLGELGVNEVLVEAGPAVSRAMLELGFWNRHIEIRESSSLRVKEYAGPARHAELGTHDSALPKSATAQNEADIDLENSPQSKGNA